MPEGPTGTVNFPRSWSKHFAIVQHPYLRRRDDKKILEWAKSEPSCRALLLLGSHASRCPVDQFSDYDFALFTTRVPKNDDWLLHFGKPWVCVHEKVTFGRKKYPSRLVIFAGPVKADFCFFTLDVLQTLSTSTQLPTEYALGYKVLLDKDGKTASMPEPTFACPHDKKPTPEQFLQIVNEFWFKAYHVAIYLKRNDLWSAKSRTSGLIHHFLLKMIEWHTLATNHWTGSLRPQGKSMHSWVAKETWTALHTIFAHFDAQDSWPCLHHTLTLFSSLAHPTAQSLTIPYPTPLEHNITQFVRDLHHDQAPDNK